MTVEHRGNLRVMQGGRLRVTLDPRCAVAAHAVTCGPQDVRVTAMTAEATGCAYRHVCLRVGRVLIYPEGRDSLLAGKKPCDRPPNWPTPPSAIRASAFSLLMGLLAAGQALAAAVGGILADHLGTSRGIALAALPRQPPRA
jgi:hypothetical protein